MVGSDGYAPSTPAMSMQCSTIELRSLFLFIGIFCLILLFLTYKSNKQFYH